MPDFLKIVDLADKLGFLQTIKNKLIGQPDVAFDKLVAVLGEISKIYSAIDAELVNYLSLFFDPGGDLQSERRLLLTLEGGQVAARIEQARGHCHKIENIFSRYLRPWFEKALSPDEFKQTQELFRRLSEADYPMIEDLKQVGAWLSAEATETLNLVDSRQFDEANTRVKAARLEINPTRKAIQTALANLSALQSEFIQHSGVT